MKNFQRTSIKFVNKVFNRKNRIHEQINININKKTVQSSNENCS